MTAFAVDTETIEGFAIEYAKIAGVNSDFFYIVRYAFYYGGCIFRFYLEGVANVE